LREIERGFGEEGAEAARAALARWREREADIEFRVSVPSPTAQRVLLGWCLRYGLTPYQTPRQRKTTMCVRVPRGFMHEVMWPRVDTMAELIERETTDAVTRIVERWCGASLGQDEGSASQTELFDDGR
jgi:hypothetical protein